MEELEFDKPVVELKNKMKELEDVSIKANVDLSAEIVKLAKRLEELEEEDYENMKPWDRVQTARHPSRQATLDYIPYLFTDFMELRGDRTLGDDAAIASGIAKFRGLPITVLGHQRGKDTKENIRSNFGMPHPEGYSKALGIMKQADEFRRPIVCFIDTKGDYPGTAAEGRGQSEAIAENLLEMASLKVPAICIVIGEGGRGGAIALGVGNYMHMLVNSANSVMSPEGAASILRKDSDRAKQAAERMRITAPDLEEMGIVDTIIPEVRGGELHDDEAQAEEIETVLFASLREFKAMTEEELAEHRYDKFRAIGEHIF
ncbi:acetyl-CoA carboxylase carboxyl transferase subunit alpha [Niallia taxi]|nr:acetyl-CoA carboxylase carboxyl transferase subunit alpha [Niallia taxi]MDE5052310.1 acetyl-CoA carboxylase carboxyl transferase subunit alpha [Niallia taxi]